MIKFDIIIIWISTLIWILFTPFIFIFCCKKRPSNKNEKDGVGGVQAAIKSKKCNNASGLLKDDPDLKSQDKVTTQTTEMMLQSNKKVKSKRASREPTAVTVTREQDTDLRSFLSEKIIEKKGTSKQLELAPTQEFEEPAKEKKAGGGGGKKNGKVGGGFATLECTQNDSEKKPLQEMVTQNDNTAEIPAKAEETLKPLQPQGMDGKSTMLGKSVMIGQKSTVIGQSVMVGKSVIARKSTVANKTDPMKQPKVPQSMVKAPPSLGPPKSAAIGAFPGGAGEMPNQSKYMAA